MFAPIIPFTSEKIQKFFSLGPILGNANNGIPTPNLISRAVTITIPEGTKINTPHILFSHIEDDFIKEQIAKLG